MQRDKRSRHFTSNFLLEGAGTQDIENPGEASDPEPLYEKEEERTAALETLNPTQRTPSSIIKPQSRESDEHHEVPWLRPVRSLQVRLVPTEP